MKNHGILFVVLLLLSTRSTYSTVRHRYSFFSEPDDSPQSNYGHTTLSYQTSSPTDKNDTVHVQKFVGVREWKVEGTTIEVLKVINTVGSLAALKQLETQSTKNNTENSSGLWKREWTARVQFSSESLAHLPPYILGPVPGVHVAFSFGGQNGEQRLNAENEEFMALCRYMNLFFGLFICDADDNMGIRYGTIDLTKSILINLNSSSPHFYLHVSCTFHHQLAIFASSMIGEYITRGEIHEPTMFDFSLRFDEKVEQVMVNVRGVWRCREHAIDIVKSRNVDERVEVGVFDPPILEDTFLGVRTVVGQDRNAITPTMITIPSLILNSTNFDFKINPSQSFHPVFHTTIHAPPHTIPTCQTYLTYILPESFIVDRHRLDKLFQDQQLKVWGEPDLEKPAGVKLFKWGNLVLIQVRENVEIDNQRVIKLPVHMRYPQSAGTGIFDSQSYASVTALWPMVAQICDAGGDDDGSGKASPFFPTPLPLSILFSTNSKNFAYILPEPLTKISPRNPQDYYPPPPSSWPTGTVSVPIGQLTHLKVVEWWIVLATVLGFVCVAWVSVHKWIEWEYYLNNNKLD